MEDELLDIVDQNDQVIGQKWRLEIQDNRKDYIIRAVWLFIENDQNKLWIPRRTAQKKSFPLSLDASACGHVSAGETYEQALLRETMEELNLDLNLYKFDEIAYISSYKFALPAFVKVYKLKSNIVPNYNKEDFVEYFWLEPKEILEKISQGEKAKDGLPIIIREVFGL